MVLIPIRVEPFRVFPYLRVHVHAPNVQDNSRSFGEELAINPIVYGSSMSACAGGMRKTRGELYLDLGHAGNKVAEWAANDDPP